MAKKDRFPEGYPAGCAMNCESEGSGSSGRIDTEITISEGSIAPKRKWINLNCTSRDGFAVPIQVLPLSKLSPSERKRLVLRLRSELEQIQILQKKVESHRTNAVTVSSSSDILSCSNGGRAPPVGNIKKSSMLTSGTLKKSSTSGHKGRGWNRGTSGRFESVNQASVPNSDAILMKQCENLLKKLMAHQFGWVFNEPVDIVKLNIPDYFNVIKHPMDLGTIKSRIASGYYSSPLQFLDDVRLTFSNAMTYNPPGNDVHAMADTMSKFFEMKWKAIDKKLPADLETLEEKSDIQEEIEIVRPMAATKKRKLSPLQQTVNAEPIRCKMTDEQKHSLSRDLQESLGDLPDNIIDFLRKQSSSITEAAEDEIEIDIDVLSDDTLFTLRKLLDEHMLNRQKNNVNAEACEIELPIESGLSNSSMQVDKGDNAVDEDVDVGGDAPPISSYRPVDVENNIRVESHTRIDDRISAGDADSDSGSSFDSGSKSPKGQAQLAKDPGCSTAKDVKTDSCDMVDGYQSASALDQLEASSQLNSTAVESNGDQDGNGESTSIGRQVSPTKLYRAALLKNRFADTILKAREKTLSQGDKGDPEKLRRQREELEMQKRKEKARLQAEAKAAEDARRREEAEAAAEARRKRELEREAARQALLKMEKTVEINENSRFLEDLEMLRAAAPEQLPSSVDETSPDHSQDALGSFKFGSSNPLEQLGLFMKMDEDDEEGEPPSVPSVVDDVEEGEID